MWTETQQGSSIYFSLQGFIRMLSRPQPTRTAKVCSLFRSMYLFWCRRWNNHKNDGTGNLSILLFSNSSTRADSQQVKAFVFIDYVLCELWAVLKQSPDGRQESLKACSGRTSWHSKPTDCTRLDRSVFAWQAGVWLTVQDNPCLGCTCVVAWDHLSSGLSGRLFLSTESVTLIHGQSLHIKFNTSFCLWAAHLTFIILDWPISCRRSTSCPKRKPSSPGLLDCWQPAEVRAVEVGVL